MEDIAILRHIQHKLVKPGLWYNHTFLAHITIPLTLLRKTGKSMLIQYSVFTVTHHLSIRCILFSSEVCIYGYDRPLLLVISTAIYLCNKVRTPCSFTTVRKRFWAEVH
jgi:hypothetical protein